jgi:hypothetical protein
MNGRDDSSAGCFGMMLAVFTVLVLVLIVSAACAVIGRLP